MQLPNWITSLFSKIGAATKAALKRWKGIIETERGLLIADMAVQAGPLISEMANDDSRTGREKRDYVASALISTFTRHALIAGGRIAASELSLLAHCAIENELVARLIEGSMKK